jgi:hypothetical protein
MSSYRADIVFVSSGFTARQSAHHVKLHGPGGRIMPITIRHRIILCKAQSNSAR